MKNKFVALAWRIGVAGAMAVAVSANGQQIEGLPDDVPRQGVVITVDVSTNHAYLFRDGDLLDDGRAATGTEKVLIHGDDMWMFHTPRGHLKVKAKIKDPVWTKPDWAFIEAGEAIPPPDSPLRQAKGVMGKYALSLGDGIYIHGTDDPASIGKKASHGCVRLPAKLIKEMYDLATVGTDVYIFDSAPPPPVPAAGGEPEHHSDFDYRNQRH